MASTKTKRRKHRATSRVMRPVGTWVDQDTKQNIFTHWSTSGYRSEAEWVRTLILLDLGKDPSPNPDNLRLSEGRKVGGSNILRRRSTDNGGTRKVRSARRRE